MEVVYGRCCGLDVHKEIRTFRTMTLDLVVLHDWLLSHGITHVAMESSVVYWKPVFNLLEASFTALLVNAAHIKAVPARKTDVKDCEWIADLLAHGLLKGSFIPPQHYRHLASWSGLSPSNNESAGKRKSGKTRKGDSWLKRSLLEASWSSSRAKDTYLCALYHRLARRKGKKKAIVLVAHSIIVMSYHILRGKVPYNELGADYFDRLNIDYVKHHFVKRLESLGYKVILESAEGAA